LKDSQYITKRRDRCVLFLDDCFDADETPERLLKAGFCQIEPFWKHFQRRDGGKEQGVKDPRVLRLCNSKRWLLVTMDSDIRLTHVEEIKKLPDLAILATAHNSGEYIEEWVDALIKVKVKVEREFKKRARPWFAQYSRKGVITTIYTIEERHGTLRDRSNEKGVETHVVSKNNTNKEASHNLA
jgi:hypothetical protein